MLNFRKTLAMDVELVELRKGAYIGAVEKDFIRGILGAPGTYGYTYMEGGKVAGIIVGVPVTKGVLEICALLSEEITKHPIKFVKSCKILLDTVTDALRLHRLQCVCRADFPTAARFIEFMGFEKEGVLKKAAMDRSDLIMFGRCP